MINYNNKILYKISITALSLFISNHSIAVENIIKLKGTIESQAIYYKNNGQLNQQKLSPYRKDIGFISGGNFILDYAILGDNDIKYGSKIGFRHTTRNDNSTPLSIYVESPYGKIEAGSNKNAAQTMKITGYSGCVAIGGSWSMVVQSSPNNDYLAYILDHNGFLDTKTRIGGEVEFARKISYYTPYLNLSENQKIQFGITYIPDSSNSGFKAHNEKVLYALPANNTYKFSAINGFSGALSYENQINKKLTTTFTLAGETATPKVFDKTTENASNIKLKKISTYSIGSEIKYDNLQFAISYMNYNKSLTSNLIDKLGKSSYVYGFGVKYIIDKFAVGANQFNSNYKGNKFNTSSIGLDYNVATGLKFYTQYSYYKANGRYLDKNQQNKKDKSEGHLAFIGAKVSI